MCACSSGSTMLFSTLLLFLLIKCTEGQEMLENARCNHYPDRGTCEDRGFTVKWYYDRYAHRCKQFYYGGCEGNDNRFETLEECSQACKYESPEDPKKRCALPHDPGTCAGNFERWHFDIRIRQCVCSWWSGCGGNANLYYSYDHCMSICGIFADNRTAATRLAARRSIQNSENQQLYKARTLAEGRQYRNLFVNQPTNGNHEVHRIRLQYNTPYSARAPPTQRAQRPYQQNQLQQQVGQPSGRYRYLVQYGTPHRLRFVSNRLRQYPGQPYGTSYTYVVARKRGRLPDGRQMPQAIWERIKAKQMQKLRGQEQPQHRQQLQQQPSRQPSYARPQFSQARPQSSQVHADQASYAREMAAAQERERLQAQQRSEAYAQQQQVYERARAEALRERERLAQQQRQEEYERTVKYQQELHRYQQAVEAAQNRVPKGRVGDEALRQQQLLLQQQQYQQQQQHLLQQQQQQQQQQLLQQQQQQQQQQQPQGQYWVPGNGQQIASYGPSAATDTRNYDEIKRAKAKLRKRLKFEKLKQMEKMRKLLKTTPRPITTAPSPPLQPQWPSQSAYEVQQQPQQPQTWTGQEVQTQQHPQTWPEHDVQRQQQPQQPYIWSEQVPQPSSSPPKNWPEQDDQRSQPGLEYGRPQSYAVPQSQYPQPQQQFQHYQPQPDPYQALYDRAQQGQPKSEISQETVTTTSTEPAIVLTQPEKQPVTEVLDMRRNHQNNGPDPYQTATDQLADSENDDRDRVKTDAERLRYGMVVAADRVPERDGIRHAERISTGPPPADTFERGKQIVAIGDYEEDEHYIDDDGYRTDDGVEDQKSDFPDGTTEHWAVSTTLEAPHFSTSSPSSRDADHTSSMQQPETDISTITPTQTPEIEQAESERTPPMPEPQQPPVTHVTTPVRTHSEEDEDRGGEEDAEVAEDGGEEEEIEYEDSEELFFWRPQGRRNGRDTEYSYYADVDTSTKTL